MGKMKDLAIRIDEIMEKIEESLNGYDEISKIYIYNNLGTKCINKEVQLIMERNGPKKEDKDD